MANTVALVPYLTSATSDGFIVTDTGHHNSKEGWQVFNSIKGDGTYGVWDTDPNNSSILKITFPKPVIVCDILIGREGYTYGADVFDVSIYTGNSPADIVLTKTLKGVGIPKTGSGRYQISANGVACKYIELRFFSSSGYMTFGRMQFYGYQDAFFIQIKNGVYTISNGQLSLISNIDSLDQSKLYLGISSLSLITPSIIQKIKEIDAQFKIIDMKV